MIAKLILDHLISSGSKKAVYFLYSAELGGFMLIAIAMMLVVGAEGIILLIVGGWWAYSTFNQGRKYTNDSPKTFAIKLLKWSALAVPFDIALAGVAILIAFSAYG